MRTLVALLVSVVAVTAVLALTPSPAPAGERSPDPGATTALQTDLVDDGRALYLQGCASCHGPEGGGVDEWPAIVGAGAASADFYLRTGRMPFTNQAGLQAERKPPAYDDAQIEALVAYVASLGDGPEIPTVELDESLLGRGSALFIANCAACHGATANGGAVGGGAVAPPLGDATPLQVAEAMIIGPGQMPVFDYPEEDRNAIVTYVEFLRTQPDPGGLEIGGIGPVPEGFVAWTVGMGALLIIVVLVGREWQTRKGEPDA